MIDRDVTLQDVARRAGVSPNTASRALNNKDGVSRSTREAVIRAACELNYIRNDVASSLRRRSTRAVGMITTDLSNPVYATLVKGAQRALQELGWQLMVSDIGQDAKVQDDAINTLMGKRVDGLLISPASSDDEALARKLDQLPIPCVSLLRNVGSARCGCVESNNRDGMYELTEHVLLTGRSRLLYVSMSLGISSALDRFRGFQDAVKDHSDRVEWVRTLSGGASISDGLALVADAIAEDRLPDVVMCACDLLAIGAMEALLAKGLRIPEDVALTGFDDMEFSQYLKTPLTTVRQDTFKIGYEGARLLISQVAGGQPAESNGLVIPVQLVLRDSA